MPFTFANGSATVGTAEYYLISASTTKTDQTDDAIIQGWIDFDNMIAGDQYRVRAYEKVNGGAQQVAYEAFLDGVQATFLVLPALVLGEAWEYSLKKLAGTDRVIAWSIRKLT